RRLRPRRVPAQHGRVHRPGGRLRLRRGPAALPRLRRSPPEAPPRLKRRPYRRVSTTQTWPRAKVIGWPDAVVKGVPPSGVGRDQCPVHALPSRSTSVVPDPTLSAYGGRNPYSLNREVRTVVCWITTVAAESRAPAKVNAGVPSIVTSQRHRD